MLLVRQALVAEHDDQEVLESLHHLCQHLRLERPGEVDAGDLAAAGAGQRLDSDAPELGHRQAGDHGALDLLFGRLHRGGHGRLLN